MRGGSQVFTSRAKRSRDYGDGGFGLRIAHLRDSHVVGTSISDARNVPIEYDLVPTEITAPFFGKTQKVRPLPRSNIGMSIGRCVSAAMSRG